MAIRSLSDVNAAFDAGRFHSQRFYKGAGSSGVKFWQDATYSPGQPGYDAHVGVPLAFTPCIAQKNDAVWFPGINPGEERYLIEIQNRFNQATFQGPAVFVLFDLLGYYPLIDGDSTDQQFMDNTQTLPRYTDGVGVFPVMVNHVAPAVQNGRMTVAYTDSDGVSQSALVDVPNNGQNLIVSGSRDTVGAVPCSINMALNAGIKGVRSIDSITYDTPPSGLHVIYLVRILGTMVYGDNGVAAEKNFFTQNGCAMPRIYDGAWLSWVSMNSTGATATTVSHFGMMTFVWG